MTCKIDSHFSVVLLFDLHSFDGLQLKNFEDVFFMVHDLNEEGVQYHELREADNTISAFRLIFTHKVLILKCLLLVLH